MQAKDRFGWSGTAIDADDGKRPVEVDAKGAQQRTKRCPRCGQTLFADMDVCYGCLYDFKRSPAPPILPDDRATRRLTAKVADGIDDLDELATPGTTVVLNPVSRTSVHTTGDSVAVLVRTGDVDVLLAIPASGLRVGRAPTNDVVLHSKAVSREHAMLVPAEGGVLVQDLGSTNPPLYQGRPIEGSALVPFGQAFMLCGSQFEPRTT